MRFIRPESTPLIDAARTLPESTRGADAAAAALRADHERWSRTLWGVGAFLVFAVGALLTGMMVDLLVGYATTAAEQTPAVALVVLGVALAAAGLVVLFRLWRTGRALSRAAVIWSRVPYLLGVRDRSATGWLAPRPVRESPVMFVRVAACALLLLVAVFGLSIVFFPGREAMVATSVACVLIGAVAAFCLAGLFGGIVTTQRGIRERDPRWVRALAR